MGIHARMELHLSPLQALMLSITNAPDLKSVASWFAPAAAALIRSVGY